MKKKISAFVCAAVLMLGTVGCGKNIQRSRETDTVSAAPAASTDKQTSGTAAPDSQPAEESEDETPATTSAPTETTTTTTTTTKKPDPVPVDNNIIAASPVWFSEIHEVTSNEKLEECLNKLREFTSKYGYNLGFSYENMDNGVIISYNASSSFWTCSTVKAPYVKSILEQDDIDLDEMITIGTIWTGDTPEGDQLYFKDKGKQYSVRKLIENTILLSDNTAYNNLVDRYGRQVFNNLQYRIGCNYFLYDPYIFTKCTPDDMRRSYRDIYNFAKENEKGQLLVDLLANAEYNKQIGAALGKKYTVAQKYGTDYETTSYSDCAICYAESPFVLCIYTIQKPETDEANKMFQDLALIFDELNEIIIS
ncbi:MAG: serine hydrolase [Ruminococcus sp.]|nr:serine hydrolase [Ruminococcus sp.]